MTGIFTGSFHPFTIRHDHIVRRALPLFSRLVIGVGLNELDDHVTIDIKKRGHAYTLRC